MRPPVIQEFLPEGVAGESGFLQKAGSPAFAPLFPSSSASKFAGGEFSGNEAVFPGVSPHFIGNGERHDFVIMG